MGLEDQAAAAKERLAISEFLAKPITANLIYRRIKTLIEHPRPFVRKGTYFGPDRRRHDQHHTSVERRARVANGTNGPEVISVEEVLRASADARAKSKADNDDFIQNTLMPAMGTVENGFQGPPQERAAEIHNQVVA